MTFHISLVGRRNLSAEIYRQVRDAIINGVLRPGDRLPASRELARTLSASGMTVTVFRFGQRKSHGMDVRLPYRIGGLPRLTSETIASVPSNVSGPHK